MVEARINENLEKAKKASQKEDPIDLTSAEWIKQEEAALKRLEEELERRQKILQESKDAYEKKQEQFKPFLDGLASKGIEIEDMLNFLQEAKRQK